MKCDRCGDDVRVTTTFRNVYFDNGVVSQIRSKYTVCGDCESELRDSDEWEL